MEVHPMKEYPALLSNVGLDGGSWDNLMGAWKGNWLHVKSTSQTSPWSINLRHGI